MAILVKVRYPGFAKRFREACADANAPDTQVALGKFLGVSGTMAWNYRNGEKLPAMETAIAIAKKLNVFVEWLISGRGPKHLGDIGTVVLPSVKRVETSYHILEEQLKLIGDVTDKVREEMFETILESTSDDGKTNWVKIYRNKSGEGNKK